MRGLCAVLALLLLAGCSILDTKVERGYSEDGGWSTYAGDKNWPTGTTFTTADVRIITQRKHPVLHNPILCVEPSPDVADALSNAAGLTAKGGTTTVDGSLSISGVSSEAVAELAGRSTALLGLRDGLFQACEAYANGAIGQDDYALITSVYGKSMTTLFLAQDVTTASARAGAAVTSPPNQPPGGSDSDDSGAGNTPKSGTAPAKASVEIAPSGLPGVTLAAEEAGLPIQTVAAPALAPKPTPATPSDTGSTADKQVAAGIGGNASAAMPLALVRMNEDYMHGGLLGTLLVACVNEYDPSRDMAPGSNAWLKAVCEQLKNTDVLTKLEKADAAVDATEGYKAVDPATAAIAAPSGGAKTPSPLKKAATPVKKVPSPIIYVARRSPASNAETQLRGPATPALPVSSGI
jgi:hypothetical protein